MHAGDLGAFQDAVGGLFFIEISTRRWHRSYAAGILYLNLQLKDFYTANRGLTQIHLTVNMVRGKDGAFPTLKCKAAECRHLAAFAVVLARRQAHGARGREPFAFPPGPLRAYSEEYRTLIVQMAEGMNNYHQACQAEVFSAAICRTSMSEFLHTMSSLRALFRRGLPAERQAAQPFPLRPKAHMLDHLVRQKIALWGTPRNFWCYGDEDFVGAIKRIAMQTKHPKSMERVLLAKYRLFAGLHAYSLALANV